MFLIVRCSLKFEAENREVKETGENRKVTTEQKGKSGFHKHQAEQAEKDKRKAETQAGRQGTDKSARQMGVFMDGSEFLFAPYDFSGWTEAELEVMDKHLLREKKQLRERLLSEAEAAVRDLSAAKLAANTMQL